MMAELTAFKSGRPRLPCCSIRPIDDCSGMGGMRRLRIPSKSDHAIAKGAELVRVPPCRSLTTSAPCAFRLEVAQGGIRQQPTFKGTIPESVLRTDRSLPH